MFTGKHLCWSLFLIKRTYNFVKKRLQHRCFPVNIANILRTAFLHKAAFGFSNESIIFREITVSKSQGQHAAQFNLCTYEGLPPAAFLRNFRAATFGNDSGWLFLRRKQKRRRACSDPCGFRFPPFPGEFFHEPIFFFHKSSHSRAFQFGLCYPFF